MKTNTKRGECEDDCISYISWKVWRNAITINLSLFTASTSNNSSVFLKFRDKPLYNGIENNGESMSEFEKVIGGRS